MNALLTINLPPALEEDLVDYLLSLESVDGFTSYDVKGHGDHVNLSIAEQVSGRKNRKQFEILIDSQDYEAIVGGLLDSVGKDVLFWQSAIQKHGQT